MTKKLLLIGIAFLFAGIPTMAAPQQQTETICTLTNEKVEGCCCEKQDNGKLFCTKAQKEVQNCCCKAVEK